MKLHLFDGTAINVPIWLIILLALAVAVLGVGRFTRLIVVDVYPPVKWGRDKWISLTRDRAESKRLGQVVEGAWGKLVTCWWCAAPYVAVVCIAWGWLSSLHWSWWAFWGWLAVAYSASMVIERDEA